MGYMDFLCKVKVEENVIRQDENQRIVKVTYSYDGYQCTTPELYYRNIKVSEHVDRPECVEECFKKRGVENVYWLDIEKHKWPVQSPDEDHFNKICSEIAGKDGSCKDFFCEIVYKNLEIFLKSVSKDRNFVKNILTNNHWHDIILLGQAYINPTLSINLDEVLSRMVYNWHTDLNRRSLDRCEGFCNYQRKLFDNLENLKKNVNRV